MIAFLVLLDSAEDRNEFTDIFMNYHMDVYRIAYSILKDHHLAEDVGQIVFEKIAKKFDKIKTVNLTKRKSYIISIAKNTAYDLLDKEKGVFHLNVDHSNSIPDVEKLLEEKIIDMENHNEMCEVLEKINPSYSDILHLRYYQELNINEISEIINAKEGSVRVKLHRAIEAMRKIVKKEVSANES